MIDSDIFMTCNSKSHTATISGFKYDRVPSSHFINSRDGSFFKMCYDCRKYHSTRPKKEGEHDEHGRYKCRHCRSIRTKDFCEKCTERSLAYAKKRTQIHNQVIWERIAEIGCCCERCKQVFLKKSKGNSGFVTVNSLQNVKQDDIEYRNMEFDHLTKDEQLSKFGQYYGPKKKGVAAIHAYRSKKDESKKCMLLCL